LNLESLAGVQTITAAVELVKGTMSQYRQQTVGRLISKNS